MNVQASARRTFSSLSNPNYRKYFFGQTTSLVGTWMQTTAQSWLVFTLTHSATAIGWVVALQTLPVLLLGPYGGVVADRVDKRRLMVILQSLMGLQAAALAVLSLTHRVTFADVCVLAVILGLNNAFENPSRQSFILEMVGPKDLRNAVSLNSTMNNVARVVGPAAAGILIAAVGEGWCFALNAVSFVAVVASLMAMDFSTLMPAPRTERARGQLREGLNYVRHTPTLAVPLVMMGLVGMLTYEFQVTLPVVAERVFHGHSTVYGTLMAVMGVGAVVGGLFTAARGRTGLMALVRTAALFGVAMVFATLAPSLALELVALVLVGFTSVSFLSIANSTLQLGTDPQMRGRVMALWAVAFMGSTPIGGPLVGWITNTVGGRVGLATGAAACVVAALIGLVARRRLERQHRLVSAA
ncbi:MAG TPA: MFS transporter [Acidimicrobiales bacterium]|nr:MAG: MFS transporter [Actinobacteria bacterium 21-73-9]HQU26270.1 MFS transporter [Acidimicrobiales bacterium]